MRERAVLREKRSAFLSASNGLAMHNFNKMLINNLFNICIYEV
jgi:hypothetical protein